MAVFEYKVVRPDGKKITKVIEAQDYAHAFNQLKASGLEPQGLVEVAGMREEKERRMSLKNTLIFSQQFGTMLSAGIPIAKAFDILREQSRKTKKRSLNAVYERIYQDIQKGKALHESMLSQGKVFNQMLIHTFHAGEVSGSLDTVTEKTTEYYHEQHQLQSTIKTAMIYPIALLVMITAIVIVLFTWVLPKFFVTFELLRIELPPLTKGVIGVSDFLINKWLVIILVIVGCRLLFSIVMTNPKYAYSWDVFKLKIPIVRGIISKLAIANFSSTMGVLYGSGVSLIESLGITTEVLSNRYYKASLKSIMHQVEAGKMLSVALEEEQMFDPLVASLLMIGEEAGDLERMFSTLHGLYQEELQANIKRMLSLLEMVMIILIAIMVFIIVAAVIIPTFTMATSVSETPI